MNNGIDPQISNKLTRDNPNSPSQSNPEKRGRMEYLSYLKSHLDIVAIGLTITYLIYSIIQIRKKQKL